MRFDPHRVIGGPDAWLAEQRRRELTFPICPRCTKHRHDAGPDRWCRMCTIGGLIDVDLSIPGLDPVGRFLAIPIVR